MAYRCSFGSPWVKAHEPVQCCSVLYSGPGSLIHQSAAVVRRYGSDVPGSALRPNASVRVKLPIGVADRPSLVGAASPAEPSHALVAGPYLRHCPPDFCHPCNVAVVLDRDGAATVITLVASPVGRSSGSPAAAGAGRGVLVGRGVVRGAGGALVVRFGPVVRGDCACDDDADGIGDAAVEVCCVARGRSAELGVPSETVEEHAAAVSRTQVSRTRRRTRTPLACHVTPMRMRGWAVGVSHRMIDTSVLCGIEMQPAVAEPSLTCRKNALPAPCRTPVGELRVL